MREKEKEIQPYTSDWKNTPKTVSVQKTENKEWAREKIDRSNSKRMLSSNINIRQNGVYSQKNKEKERHRIVQNESSAKTM